MAGERARITLIAPDPDFVYKPLLVEEPFGLGPPEQYALEPLAEESGAEFLLRSVSSVDPGAHRVELDDGSSVDYDYLIVCVGARFVPALPSAITFPNPTEPLRIDPVLDRAAAGAGRIAFVVPGRVTWSLPLYELALMTDRRARERGEKVEVTLITPETTPLAAFGATASSAVAELLGARGIEVVTGERAHEEGETLILTPGDRKVEADVVIALPAIEGPAIEGLPADDGGFLPVDDHSRVRGAEDVYAAGDGTDFPLKQGGLATQQADVAAADIAHRLGAADAPEPFRPVLRGQLLTGDASLQMQADVAGGGGEGTASLDRLWWPPHKISGRYLAPMLYRGDVHAAGRPPGDLLEIDEPLADSW
jgi:sulfide:quinone oxidoreductase